MNYLKHVGVLGMKWGIRKRGPASSDHSKAMEIKKKHVSELTNDELKTVISRMQLEKQFKDINSASVGKGGKFVSAILQRVGAQLVNEYVSGKAGPGYAGYQAFAQAIRNRNKPGG